ncbi:MAG: GNAT family N-acetyltransferase [Bacteroidales bacterium]|nr:MAG: GNAT family N-acetyltransferase [Bacteroidales bacterium]
MSNYALRFEPLPGDVENVREIIQSSGFFLEHEIPVALELVEDAIEKGDKSDYFFVFAMDGERTISYACYGTIACTKNSYDLYWIATHQDYRGKGVGSLIIRETEKKIKSIGGRAIYIETSSKPLYVPTQSFYEKHGYLKEAVLKDYYDINDSKIVYSKHI